MRKKILAAILGAICVLTTAAPALCIDDSAADLIGLWGCERGFGPEVRGELTLVQQGSAWHAFIAGFDAPVRSENGLLTFNLAGERGSFRGKAVGGKIIGHWIQPKSLTNGSAWATPVELMSGRDKIWRGQVSPLEDRFSLYLVISKKQDGSLGAFIRNPEANAGVRLRLGQVLRQGEVVRLVDQRRGEMTGRYDKEQGTLSFAFPFAPGTFDFTRRTRDQATGFYPRTPAVSAYEYHQPLPMDDGWTTASLADVGLDAKPVAALVQSILQTETDSARAPYIQGLLIARHGKLVLDEYFYGFYPDLPHDTRSASKTLGSPLIGIAIDKGAAFNVKTPIYTLFPQYKSFAHDGPDKRKITVENLLTMTSGYDCDENNDASAGQEDKMQNQSEQPDWYKFALDLPMVAKPGEKGVYCSNDMNLLGGIVTSVTGKWLPEFFQENYAAPLDIKNYQFGLMPTGNGYLGGGTRLRPRDFIKLGQLYLDRGRWNGRQVVSKKWVEESLQPRSSLQEKDDYGYTWHLNNYQVGGKTYRGYNAGGNGGQLVIVIPELDLVVGITAGNYGDFQTWIKFNTELIPKYIIPAAAK